MLTCFVVPWQTFLGNNEAIFGHIANAGSETTFTDLNGGNPILTATTGTKGVRDPYFVKSPNGDQYWIIGVSPVHEPC